VLCERAVGVIVEYGGSRCLGFIDLDDEDLPAASTLQQHHGETTLQLGELVIA